MKYRDQRDTNVYAEVVTQDCYKLRLHSWKPDIAIDCGGHIGYFSTFAHELYPNAEIIGFEPNPQNAELYRKNCPFAILYEGALWYEETLPILMHTESQTGSDFTTSNPEPVTNKLGYYYEPSNPVTPLTISVIQFDPSKRYLLKLDCEGAEYGIMREIAQKGIGHLFEAVVGEWHNEAGDTTELRECLRTAFPHLSFSVREGGFNNLFLTVI